MEMNRRGATSKTAVPLDRVVASAVISGQHRIIRRRDVRWRQRTLQHEALKGAFTLIELLVVIVIVAILAGLSFPVYQTVQDMAKRTQAKHDLLQIVAAVNAFYNEYGKYPLAPATAADTSYGGATTNGPLLNELRNVSARENPRAVVFFNPPEAKDQSAPRGGIKVSDGQFYDPWGKPYLIRIDTNYDGFVSNPYTSNAGTARDGSGALAVQAGLIAWSLGKNQAGGTGDKHSGDAKDDVISWQ